MSQEMKSFIEEWSYNYNLKTQALDLFNSEITNQWNTKQKQKFVWHFYHARGHFHDFLWYVGNHAESKEVKDVILQNIAEELNFNALSHEQMYLRFADFFDVDLSGEIIKQSNYPNYIREFNLGHLTFLEQNSPENGFTAFAAYERLDNLDYKNLYKLAESMGAPRKALAFFKVHMDVTHFEATEDILKKIWQKKSENVVQIFDFIGKHQLRLWKQMASNVNINATTDKFIFKQAV